MGRVSDFALRKPVYPYFNGLFPTPFDPPAFIRDIKFIQTAWFNRIFLPFLFAFNPLSVGEIRGRILESLFCTACCPSRSPRASFRTQQKRA